jgi:hypothetical protein
MINKLRYAATLSATLVGLTFDIAAPAFSQAPTDAQRSAIRSQCRSDYQAHCASVPPGGMEALQCLQKNMSGLSAGCQTAVRAVEPPPEPKAESAPAAAPKAEPAPAAAAAKPATETAAPAPATATAAPKPAPEKPATGTAAKKPGNAQVTAIESSCRSDYPKVCAGVPTGGAEALQCLEKNKSKLSSGCQQAVSASGGGAAAPTAGVAPAAAATAKPAAAPAAAPAPVLVLRPMRSSEELFVLRSACGGDVRTLCGVVVPGGGRIMQCLATQAASLSPACTDVLAQFAAQ